MERDRTETTAAVLALVLAAGYALSAVVGAIADVTDGDGSDLVFWLVFLLGGAALLVAGLYAVRRWSWPSVLLVSVGALAGALVLVWSLFVPLLALVLIALAVRLALRGRSVAAHG
jgi:hypothetical protein